MLFRSYTAMAVQAMTRAMGPRKVPLETIPKLSSVIATTARQGMSPASRTAFGVTRNDRKRQASNPANIPAVTDFRCPIGLGASSEGDEWRNSSAALAAMKVAFYNHSLHSDGDLSLWELANEGVRSGLDYLGCTDHNTSKIGRASCRERV